VNKYLKLSNYIKFLINKILYLLFPMIRIFEIRYIKNYSNQPLQHQPVFIIGAPRTGSTILYQTITNQLDVLYVDNLVCRFYKNFFFGFWLSNKLFKQKAHNCFKSNHGDTSKYGLRAPSECGQFWYRWLPTERHFIDYDDISDKMVKEIRNEITAVINYFDKPLVFNNNNIALRIRLIEKVFPNAKYIIADRERIFVAQSLLKARKIFFSDYDKWWSIMPKNYEELLKYPFVKQVVLQHYNINKQMYLDLTNLVDKLNYKTIMYKDLCLNKELILDILINLIQYSKNREAFKNIEIKESKKLILEDSLIKSLENEIARLDWNDYTS
jgi:hypothetical protein